MEKKNISVKENIYVVQRLKRFFSRFTCITKSYFFLNRKNICVCTHKDFVHICGVKIKRNFEATRIVRTLKMDQEDFRQISSSNMKMKLFVLNFQHI